MERIFYLIMFVFTLVAFSSCESDTEEVITDNVGEIINEIEEEVEPAEPEEEVEEAEEETEEPEGEVTEDEVEEEVAPVEPEEEVVEVETVSLIASGIFESDSIHYPDVSGVFEITQENGIHTISLSETDFNRASTIPDIVIKLSNSESDPIEGDPTISEDNVTLGFVEKRSFEISSDIDVNNYTYVLLYCREYGIQVGRGEIIFSTEN